MNDNNKIFKAAQFLQDIDLMFSKPEVLIPESQPAPPTNLVVFRDPNVAFPDMHVPEYAVSVGLKNLINTYGETMVTEALDDLKKMAG